jgi:protein-L-isoaspartate(D-aspartate) O-methyltransferase
MRFPGGYQRTPDDDPTYLYQDAPVAIRPEKGLNNGQPSFLACLISAGGLQVGEHAIHIGTGTGYCTALMRNLVGRDGRISGIEYEPELALQAKANLARFPNVEIIAGDGASLPLEPADVIYVNAGASRPADNWLDALNPGGRLVLPLTVSYTTEERHSMTQGAMFLIARESSGCGYSARCVLDRVYIYPCAGLRDEASEKALVAAFERRGVNSGGLAKVTKLYRTDDVSEERCWVHAPGWSLAYD